MSTSPARRPLPHGPLSNGRSAQLPAPGVSVFTAGEACRKCYSCVRSCPTKAIVVRAGQADIDPARCISCGQCVLVCSQSAKRVRSSLDEVRGLLASGRPCHAMIAPSFPAAFIDLEPGRLVGAVAACGFRSVHEVAFGADLVSHAFRQKYGSLTAEEPFVISTPCPAVVSCVEKIYPELVPYLANVSSPMEAMGRVIRRLARGGTARSGTARDGTAPSGGADADPAVVFVGPCVGKKDEARRTSSSVDAVLTFDELAELFAASGVDPAAAKPRPFDPPTAGLGRIYPVTGGLLKSAGIESDVLESPVLIAEGSDRVMEVLDVLGRLVREGKPVRTRVFDLLFCDGCIAGPAMPNDLSFYERKKYVVSYIDREPRYLGAAEWAAANRQWLDLDLSVSFTPMPVSEPPVPEDEIRAILARTGKVKPEDELNCRACGYASCRDKAIAVYRGIAEVEMCLPYLISRLEDAIANIKENQDRLIQAEKLASMGQMAAGIAHELNNPLGVVLMYAHLLLEELGEGSPPKAREDAERIATEAGRTRSIVQGILNFAREEKVERRPTDINALLRETLAGARSLDDDGKIRIETDFDTAMPTYRVDPRQLRQVFDNVIRNAIEVMPTGGILGVTSHGLAGAFTVQVTDTGPGIPDDLLPKLFMPFVTTKPVGRGTGLGLSVCYGIVKMHGGSIAASNRPGGGACFEITIREPVERPA
jgi:two-component system NtrC family sensor kinase